MFDSRLCLPNCAVGSVDHTGIRGLTGPSRGPILNSIAPFSRRARSCPNLPGCSLFHRRHRLPLIVSN